MQLSSDQRAFNLAVTADMVADEVRSLDLPVDASERMLALLSILAESARRLCDEIEYVPEIDPVAPIAAEDFNDNVVPFPRR